MNDHATREEIKSYHREQYESARRDGASDTEAEAYADDATAEYFSFGIHEA